MDNIITYLIFSFKAKEDTAIRTWLDCGYYPNAIDCEKGRIIVFNMGADIMCGFVKQFHISDWTFGQSAVQPDEYTELFRYYDSVICKNIVAFHCFNMGSDYNPHINMSECYRILSSGFMQDGYMKWRNRFYLSKNLLGLSAKTFKLQSVSIASIPS